MATTPSTTGPADTTNTDPDEGQQDPNGTAEGTEGTDPDGDGGSEDPDGEPNTDPNTSTEDGEADEDGLPENVKAILAKNRQAAKDAERARKAEAKRVKDYQRQLDRYREKHGDLPDEEPDPAAEALAKANQRILSAEVRAAAKGKFHDVSDAFANLDLSEFEVGDDGDVDSEAIEAALDDILEKKPYLSAATVEKKEKRFQGSADQGTPSGAADKQWTKADVDRATPEQIVEADTKGLLDNIKKGK